MDYRKEYGRYKAKYEEQKKEIERLKEEREGWRQMLDGNNAMITAMVDSIGKPVRVTQSDISEALKSGRTARVSAEGLPGGAVAWTVYPKEG